MHFTYQYINHEIEGLQEMLDFLFYEVWCKAVGEFDADKLDGHPRLQQIYIDLGNTDGVAATFFNSHVENIYAEFLKFDEYQITQLKEGYKNNNNIEGLCKDKTIQPLLYKQIEVDHPDLAKLFNSFYGNLYGSTSPFNLVIFGDLKNKLIPDHYFKFMEANKREVCPFCGLLHLKANNHGCREAYDHYLPKAIFPFCTINFKNLAPMCNECNSSYKTTKIPIEKSIPVEDEDTRKLAFYPYAEDSPTIEFKIQINTTDINSLTPDDILIEVTSAGYEEQIESWVRVFGLEERYKASLCSPDDGKAWVNSIIEGYDNAIALGSTLTRAQYFEAQYIDAKFQPETEKGFIKAPFLEACKNKGVFNINTI
ncbi:MAG: hypothetical protein H6561_05210 [Lewinellaceae bacterium]|nr:hypothetical protein [Lewinellaceae bacterium]